MPLTATGIHYQEAGAGHAVVFLHGVTVDARMWIDQVSAGAMWPISYALINLTAAEEAKIKALVRKAVR